MMFYASSKGCIWSALLVYKLQHRVGSWCYSASLPIAVLTNACLWMFTCHMNHPTIKWAKEGSGFGLIEHLKYTVAYRNRLLTVLTSHDSNFSHKDVVNHNWCAWRFAWWIFLVSLFKDEVRLTAVCLLKRLFSGVKHVSSQWTNVVSYYACTM